MLFLDFTFRRLNAKQHFDEAFLSSRFSVAARYIPARILGTARQVRPSNPPDRQTDTNLDNAAKDTHDN